MPKTDEHVLRLVFIYSRSTVLPTYNLSTSKIAESYPILNHPNFFLDALYIHNKPKQNPLVQEIFDRITMVDCKHVCFFDAEYAKSDRIFNFLALLVAHPLQRSSQKKHVTKL
jgi:hypothetical protein